MRNLASAYPQAWADTVTEEDIYIYIYIYNIRGPARGTTFQQFEVARLVPATTYYFTVVSYYSSDDAEIESTRSAVTEAVLTAVGVPA